MPWKETSAMNERVQFIADHLREEWSISELCRMYGISRPTAYKWIDRYDKEGLSGLEERSRAPHDHPNTVSEEVEEWIVEERERHPTWGPKKLLTELRKHHRRQRKWPALSTMGEILKRRGLVKSRRRKPHATPSPHPLTAENECNRVWCADFKGDFRTQDGTRCVPFTLSDAHTRFLIRCHGLECIRSARVKGLFEAAFYEYGLPEVIRTDNGPPFASVGLGGLSRLSVWWIKLGIVPERIQPGKPYQNGRHERLHRTLKEEAITPPCRTLRAQQRAFDRFWEEYNFVRPHEALGQVPPGEVYTPSPRRYSPRLAAVWYPETMQVRRVKGHGEISWRSRKVFLSEVLANESVGLDEEDEGYWGIYLGDFRIAGLDGRTMRVERADPIRRRKEGEEGEIARE